MDVETKIMDLQSYRLTYKVAGRGPAMVCFELPLNPYARLTPLQKKFARKYCVYVFDLRPVVGHSAKNPPAKDLLTFLTDFSIELLDRLEIGKFILVATFMYGGVAMNMARKVPERVTHLVLISVLGILRLPITPLLRFITVFYRLPGIPALMRIRPFCAFVEWFDVRLLGSKRMKEIFYEPEKVPVTLADLYEQYKQPRNGAAALALMWCIRNLVYRALLPKLGQVASQTLIIHGNEDQWIPFRYAEELDNRLPQSQLVGIPKTRHAPEVEDVALTYRTITDFLEPSPTAEVTQTQT